jgi:ribosomal protein S18 acetylase RimI-like enzyme
LHIHILESHQKQGLGRKLIQMAVEYLKGEDTGGPSSFHFQLAALE